MAVPLLNPTEALFASLIIDQSRNKLKEKKFERLLKNLFSIDRGIFFRPLLNFFVKNSFLRSEAALRFENLQEAFLEASELFCLSVTKTIAA